MSKWKKSSNFSLKFISQGGELDSNIKKNSISKNSINNYVDKDPQTTRNMEKRPISQMWNRNFKSIKKNIGQKEKKTLKDYEKSSNIQSVKKYPVHYSKNSKSILEMKRKLMKGSLSKFVNKGSSYLRDTAGSRNKKSIGREKVHRMRKNKLIKWS